MIIRNALLSDSTNIAKLTTQLGYAADALTVSDRLVSLANRRNQLVIVATLQEEIVGWLQAHASVVLESGFRVEIVGLIVSETCRRRGVGSNLIQHAEKWALEIGAEAVVARSNTTRVESHRFYPALGFRASKTQTVYRKELRKEPSQA